MGKEQYLGDGLYVGMDGDQIRFRAPRPTGDHYVFMNREVFIEFAKWLEREGLIVKLDVSAPGSNKLQ